MRLKRQAREVGNGGEGVGGAVATPAQLLAAASEVFAASGYRGATVRDICRRAGANVAAINYHFGGKEGLYEEVLRCGLRHALERFPPDGGVPGSAPAEERLRGYIGSFLRRLFSAGPDSVHGRLMMREMVDPTPALDAVVSTEIRGLMERLAGMIGELLGEGVDDGSVRLCVASVVSQIVFYHHCRPVIVRMFPGMELGDGSVESLTEHILRFSLGGLGRIAEGGTGVRRGVAGKRPSGRRASRTRAVAAGARRAA